MTLKSQLQTSENDVIRLQQLLSAHEKANNLIQNDQVNIKAQNESLQLKYNLLVKKYENEVKRVKMLQNKLKNVSENYNYNKYDENDLISTRNRATGEEDDMTYNTLDITINNINYMSEFFTFADHTFFICLFGQFEPVKVDGLTGLMPQCEQILSYNIVDDILENLLEDRFTIEIYRVHHEPILIGIVEVSVKKLFLSNTSSLKDLEIREINDNQCIGHLTVRRNLKYPLNSRWLYYIEDNTKVYYIYIYTSIFIFLNFL